MSLIVVLTNVSDLASESDYNYQVLVGDGSIERSRVLAQGKIEKHRRSDGWKPLVERVIKEAA